MGGLPTIAKSVMRRYPVSLSCFCFLALGAISALASNTSSTEEPSRQAIQSLLKSKSFQEDDFQNPYLIAESGILIPRDFVSVSKRVTTKLQQGALKARSHYPLPNTSFTNWNSSILPTAEEWKNEKEVEGLKKCDLDYCFPKLNDQEEKPTLMKSNDKLSTFKELISKRVELFLQSRKLLGYENRKENKTAVTDLVQLHPALGKDYGTIHQFLTKGFWESSTRPPSLVGSFLRTQTLNLDPTRLQPIYWVGEVFQFHEAKSEIFVEFVVYSNHFFDAWLRVYEVIDLSQLAPSKAPQTAIVINDLTEIDELKKSALIRMLFKGKMVEAIHKAQKLELESFEESP